MTLLPGMSPLTAAANALKSAGPGAPLVKQMDTVSNALVGSNRERAATKQKIVGLPPEARSVLEILKFQVDNSLKMIFELKESEKAYQKFVDDLEIIENFADKVIQYYKSNKEEWSKEDEDFALMVLRTLARAKSEAVAAVSLEKIYEKITGLESKYKNNPQMSKKDFKTSLTEIVELLRNWEDELIPGDPLIKDSKEIRKRISKIKAKLQEAFEISELKDHPGTVGELALNLLRVAAGMMQEAKSRFEVQQSVEMAVSAIANLTKSGPEFQEKGRSYHLIIQQSVALFIDKKIRKIEIELGSPLYFEPGDIPENSKVAEKLKNQMERLVTYNQFVKLWAGPHQDDLKERIAILYEQVQGRAVKAMDFLLDDAAKRETPFEKVGGLAAIAGKHFETEILGSDEIKPAEIFNEPQDVSHHIEALLDKIPDPVMHREGAIPFEKLGRLYHETAVIRNQKNLSPELQQKLIVAINRIEYHFLRQKNTSDIFRERIAAEIFTAEVLRCEMDRFMKLMGIRPEVTLSEGYEFKGNDLASVMKNYRILHSLFAGRYGDLKTHPILNEVAQNTLEVGEAHASKVLLEVIKRLTLSFLKPLPVGDIEKIIQTRILTVPNELRNEVLNVQKRIPDSMKDKGGVQELWCMLDYLKSTFVSPDFYAEKILQKCREHLQVAEKILFPLAKSKPELIHKLYMSSLHDIINESEQISFKMDARRIIELNEENQFHKDHQIPETLPLYVEGNVAVREAMEDIHKRLLSLTGGDQALSEWIESMATQSLFNASISTEDVKTLFCGPDDFSSVQLIMDEKSQFLLINPSSKEATVTGYAQLLLKNASEEVENVTVKIIAHSKSNEVIITFINKPYHTCISNHREGGRWKVF